MDREMVVRRSGNRHTRSVNAIPEGNELKMDLRNASSTDRVREIYGLTE